MFTTNNMIPIHELNTYPIYQPPAEWFFEDSKLTYFKTLTTYMDTLYNTNNLYKTQADKLPVPSLLLENTNYKNMTTTDFIQNGLVTMYILNNNSVVDGREFYWYKCAKYCFKNIKEQKEDILFHTREYLKERPDLFMEELSSYLSSYHN